MSDSLRQTGRTTRMLQHAIGLARHGRAVYIMVHDGRYAQTLKSHLRELLQPEHPNALLGIQIEAVPYDFDFANMRPNNARPHPNCVWLLDHVVAEQELSRVARRIREQLNLQDQLSNLNYY